MFVLAAIRCLFSSVTGGGISSSGPGNIETFSPDQIRFFLSSGGIQTRFDAL